MKGLFVNVWRYESVHDGFGPYHAIGSELWGNCQFSGKFEERTPAPREDNFNRRHFDNWGEWKMYGYLFGFRSRKQAKTWFYPKAVRCSFKKHNVFLVRYRVPIEDVVYGERQLAFKRSW